MDYFVSKNKDVPEQEVFPGIVGKLIHTPKVTIGDFRIAAGTQLPAHQHPHEQTSTVLEGQFEFTVGGQTRLCGPGDVAVIPPNVEHSATALTDCRVLDVFEPVREDYRAVTEELRAAMATEYQPIDCGFYDHFEAAIVQRREVVLVYRDDDNLHVATRTKLLDLKTEASVEYVKLSDGTWLRLDKVISLNGIRADDATCAI